MDLGERGAAGTDRGRVLSDFAAWVATTFDHAPRDPALWVRAVTHGSLDDQDSYERLEFLGDRVLGLTVAEWLYALFPDEPEGLLSRRINVLVSGATCAEVAREVGLPDRVRLGKGAKATTRDSDHVLGDVVEALLGALYLEAGLEAARGWVRRHWDGRIHSNATARKHPKAALQEWAEAKGRGLPRYTVADASGPDHQRSFTVAVAVGDATAAATAATKREAETAAAEALMATLLAQVPVKRRRTRGMRTSVGGPAA